MKESNFYSDEFEQLLREKTEQYKMYPSEKVWKGIHGSLHTKRRWFITTMSLLVTGILFFAGRELLSPSKVELVRHPAIAAHSPADTPGSTDENTSPLVALSGQRRNPASANGRHNSQNIDDRSHKEINVRLSDPAESKPDISGMLSQVVSLPAEPPSIPLIAAVRTPSPSAGLAEETASTGSVAQTGRTTAAAVNASSIPASPDRGIAFSSTAPSSENIKDNDRSTHPVRNTPPSRNSLAVTRSTTGTVTGNEALVDSSGKTAGGTVVFNDAIADQQRINWLYDYAVYNLPAAAKRGRKYFQLYLSPTASYRMTDGDFSAKASPLVRGSIKDYLDRDPSLGFEVGGMMLYKLTRNLTVKAGLQFNYSRYTAKAYIDPQQSGGDISSYYGHYLDSVRHHVNGQAPPPSAQISLTNAFYQLSAPVGFELRIMGNERLQLNIGASIQPSYLLNTNAYLLTTDYINYVKGPSQYRKFNLTGAMETFLSYKLRNGLRLQAGPEFRYQLLSTYNSEYPIRENLKGYGFKIGIVRSIP